VTDPIATVILIHGYTGGPDKPRFHWLREQLKAENVRLVLPQMPEPNHPNETAWINVIDGLVAAAEPPILLVGHSLGGLAGLRWLEERTKEPIHAFISLAGVTMPDRHIDAPYATEWKAPQNWNQIRKNAGHIAAIHSEDDTHVAMDESERLVRNTGATLLRVTGRGHFSDADGVTDLPELLQTIDTLIQLAK
jgi:predicted alpha/beta hydrolase family esterase